MQSFARSLTVAVSTSSPSRSFAHDQFVVGFNVDHDAVLDEEMRRGCLYPSEYPAEESAYVMSCLAERGRR